MGAVVWMPQATFELTLRKAGRGGGRGEGGEGGGGVVGGGGGGGGQSKKGLRAIPEGVN